jgi:phage tail protein X
MSENTRIERVAATYEVEWFTCKGFSHRQEMEAFPTLADVPEGAVRMDVALPPLEVAPAAKAGSYPNQKAQMNQEIKIPAVTALMGVIYKWTGSRGNAQMLAELGQIVSQIQFMEHVFKGDPRGVADYCAFVWPHGERTTPPDAPATPQAATEMSDDQVDMLCNRVYAQLRVEGWNGSMGGLQWDRALVRAALASSTGPADEPLRAIPGTGNPANPAYVAPPPMKDGVDHYGFPS